MRTPHPHLYTNDLGPLYTSEFWLQELRLLRIELPALEKISRAMAMICFVKTVGPSILEIGYSVDYDCPIPKRDYDCFVTLEEAGMVFHSKAFAGASNVYLDFMQSPVFDHKAKDYIGYPMKTRWWAIDYMLAAVKRLVGPVYEVRTGYYSSQYRIL